MMRLVRRGGTADVLTWQKADLWGLAITFLQVAFGADITELFNFIETFTNTPDLWIKRLTNMFAPNADKQIAEALTTALKQPWSSSLGTTALLKTAEAHAGVSPVFAR